MADPIFDSKTFFDFLWRLMTAMLIERAEREALAATLHHAGVLPSQLYETARAQKLQAARDTIQKIAQGDENAWLAVLREFEGPVQ